MLGGSAGCHLSWLPAADAPERDAAQKRYDDPLYKLTKYILSRFEGITTCFSIVEQGEQAYGKHVKKDGEEPVPEEILKKFLKVQNGADVRGVVLDGA
jgi:hypothetical protein